MGERGARSLGHFCNLFLPLIECPVGALRLNPYQLTFGRRIKYIRSRILNKSWVFQAWHGLVMLFLTSVSLLKNRAESKRKNRKQVELLSIVVR